MPSWLVSLVEAVATAMLWGEIIFAATPPLLLAATLKTGLMPSECAVWDWMLLNKCIGRSIAAGNKHPEPAEQGRKEREKCAGYGKGVANGRGHSGIIGYIGKTDDAADGHERLK